MNSKTAEEAVLFACLCQDFDEVRSLLDDFLPNELRDLRDACELIAAGIDTRLGEI